MERETLEGNQRTYSPETWSLPPSANQLPSVWTLKWLELSIPKLVEIQSMEGPRHALTPRSKGQRMGYRHWEAWVYMLMWLQSFTRVTPRKRFYGYFVLLFWFLSIMVCWLWQLITQQHLQLDLRPLQRTNRKSRLQVTLYHRRAACNRVLVPSDFSTRQHSYCLHLSFVLVRMVSVWEHVREDRPWQAVAFITPGGRHLSLLPVQKPRSYSELLKTSADCV